MWTIKSWRCKQTFVTVSVWEMTASVIVPSFSILYTELLEPDNIPFCSKPCHYFGYWLLCCSGCTINITKMLSSFPCLFSPSSRLIYLFIYLFIMTEKGPSIFCSLVTHSQAQAKPQLLTQGICWVGAKDWATQGKKSWPGFSFSPTKWLLHRENKTY